MLHENLAKTHTNTNMFHENFAKKHKVFRRGWLRNTNRLQERLAKKHKQAS